MAAAQAMTHLRRLTLVPGRLLTPERVRKSSKSLSRSVCVIPLYSLAVTHILVCARDKSFWMYHGNMTQTIRLCTWNIEFGLGLNAILDALETCDDFDDIDLLALQEASIHGDVEDARLIATTLGAHYGHYQLTAQRIDGRVQANALVWNQRRVRVLSKGSVKLPQMHEVKLSRTERTFLRALTPQQRISIMVDGQIGRVRVRVYVAHLDVIGYHHKRQQFMRVLEDTQTRPPADLIIIAGDLNTFRLLRSRPKWMQLEAAAQAAGFKDLTSEIRWTHAIRPRSLPRLRYRQKLDAIFVKYTRACAYRSWSLDVAGSDHIPVFAEIQMES